MAHSVGDTVKLSLCHKMQQFISIEYSLGISRTCSTVEDWRQRERESPLLTYPLQWINRYGEMQWHGTGIGEPVQRSDIWIKATLQFLPSDVQLWIKNEAKPLAMISALHCERTSASPPPKKTLFH